MERKANEIADKRVTFIIILIIIDGILNISICTIFVQKLRKLVLSLALDELNNRNQKFSSQQLETPTHALKLQLIQSVNLDINADRKSKLIKVMTRLTILWYVIIICYVHIH